MLKKTRDSRKNKNSGYGRIFLGKQNEKSLENEFAYVLAVCVY